MTAHGVSDYYDGSRLFSGVSDRIGISVDKFNFITSQIIALLLASLFRTALHPSKSNATKRHLFGLSVGFSIGYFCFGIQAFHLAALPTLSYIVIVTQRPQIIQWGVLLVSLLYLSLIHIHRQMYDYGSSNLDITGPLMVIVEKVTSLAFNLHDGLTKTKEAEDKLSTSQKQYAISKIPTPLEYFSYTLHFPSLMAGPAMLFSEYTQFIDGTNMPSIVNNNESSSKSSDSIVLDPKRAVFKKTAIATLCATMFVAFVPFFPISRIKDTDFVENTSLTQKILFIFVSTTLVRFKYYFVWTLADAMCNNAGIGYNGVDEKGLQKWDKFTNVDILGFEFATSLRGSIDSWNLGTNRWLRMIVYERVKSNALILTYMLSAVWHGFYPGYYLTFASGALFTYAARIVRKTVRPYFLVNAETKLFYDVLTFIITRLLMTYMVFTFVLLEFWPGVRLYTSMYWFMHLGALATIFIIPKIIPKTVSGNTSKTNIAKAIYQDITNGVSRHYD